MRIKSASLDLIAIANGQPTGDELREAQRQAEEERRQAELAAYPRWMNSKQRRSLRRVIAKGNAQSANEHKESV